MLGLSSSSTLLHSHPSPSHIVYTKVLTFNNILCLLTHHLFFSQIFETIHLSNNPLFSIQMAKTPSPKTDPEPTTMSDFELFNKLKRLKSIEPSLGVLGFFIFTVFVFIFCFFFLDYRFATKGFQSHEQTQKLRSFVGSSGGDGVKRVAFLEQGGDGCDLFRGKWVWDESYPLYKERDCPFLDQGFRCSENGRRDSFYTKWRWQPKDCNLPRFDAKTMLEKLRSRRVVFVGDSIGRNQWESFLCMLSLAVPNKTSIYEVNGSPITKHKGFLVFKIEDYNCTVEYYRAPFLVLQSRPPTNAPRNAKTTLKLDQMDWTSRRWKDADVLIFNTAHWWNYEKTIRGGCFFQEGEEVKVNMSVESAYRRSIRTVVDWIGREVNMNKTQVFFRTYSPIHFRGGDWKTGGSCHLEKLPVLRSSQLPPQSWHELSIVNDVLSDYSNKSLVNELEMLNVTHMSSWRKDGHASVYYSQPPAPLHKQDCSHWCLPGVPDAWNELFYALFLKRETTRTKNTTILGQAQAR